MAEHLDFVSFWLGLLLGLIAMLAIFTALYNARAFAFEHCAVSTKICLGAEYYNNPGSAITNGSLVSDILTVNSDGEMFYKRVPKDSCMPGDNQTIQILSPQYCFFSDNGIDGMTGKAVQFNSNNYELIDSEGSFVKTTGNCLPVNSSCFDEGTPLIKWDPVPISDEIVNT
jgi:hypothetical protein